MTIIIWSPWPRFELGLQPWQGCVLDRATLPGHKLTLEQFVYKTFWISAWADLNCQPQSILKRFQDFRWRLIIDHSKPIPALSYKDYHLQPKALPLLPSGIPRLDWATRGHKTQRIFIYKSNFSQNGFSLDTISFS